MNQYTSNSLLALSLAISTVNGATPVNADILVCKIKPPGQPVVDLTADIINDGVGSYHVDYLPTLTGLYQYEWISTGTVEVAQVGQFLVNQGIF